MRQQALFATTRSRVAFVLACMVVMTVASLAERPAPGTPTEVWPVMAVMFVGLTLTWDGSTRPGPRALGLLAVHAALLAAIAVSLGWPVVSSVWVACANAAGAVGMAWGYRRFQADGWAPTTPQAVAALLAVAYGVGVPVALVGGFPGLEPWALGDRAAWWWVIRNGVFGFIGGITFLELFHRRVVERVPLSRWAVLGLFPISAAALTIAYYDPSLPLTWVLVVPAVWAGTFLPPRGAAAHSLGIGVGAAVMSLLPLANPFAYDGVLPASLIMDLCLSAATLVAMQLAIASSDRRHALATVERQRSEAARQAELLGQVFDEMSDGLIVYDADGEVARSNAAVRQLLGSPVTRRARPGWAERFGFTTLDGAPLGDADMPGTEGRESDSATVRLGAEGRVLRIRSRPLAEDRAGHMVLFSDQTAQQKRLEELTRFAGTVAHDLRSPIASLNGWIELTQDSLAAGEPEKAAEFVERAGASALRLEQVVSDWMAYTVQHQGALNPARVDLTETLRSIVASYADDEHGPELVVDVPEVVQADPPLTRQLLANLIGNAVKFARPDTRPYVRVEARPDDEPGWVVVEVADRGIGLPPGEEDSIFEEFRRASNHGGVQGTGLGLALCRSIVVRHGGRITARTNDDGGATVSFTLPAAP